MKKKFTPTSKQLEIMKEYWELLKEETVNYYDAIQVLEIRMSEETKIKDLEFIHDEMGQGIIGIGNFDRTMKLQQIEELEKE